MSKDLVVQTEEELALLVQGIEVEEEHFSRDEIEVPFLKIAQKTSPQIDAEDEANFIEGLSVGDFFSAQTGKGYGDKIQVIVEGYYRCYTIWTGTKESRKYSGVMSVEDFEDFSTKPNVELIKNGGDMQEIGAGDPDKWYTYTMYFLVTIVGHEDDGILVFPLKSTNLKGGRQWNTTNKMRKLLGKKPPRFMTVWEIMSVTDENKAGQKFKKLGRPNPLGWASAESIANSKALIDMVASIKDSGIDFSKDSADSEDQGIPNVNF